MMQVQLAVVLCKQRDILAADQAMLDSFQEQLGSLEGLLRLIKRKEEEQGPAQLSSLKSTSAAQSSSAEAELAPRIDTPKKREDQREQQ